MFLFQGCKQYVHTVDVSFICGTCFLLQILCLNGSHDRETASSGVRDGPMTASDIVQAVSTNVWSRIMMAAWKGFWVRQYVLTFFNDVLKSFLLDHLRSLTL